MTHLKFSCVLSKFTSEQCDKSFSNEIRLQSHMLFEHGILMPVCSTGIDEKLFHDNMELIKKYRDAKIKRQYEQSLLKRRLLKQMYGKKYNMTDVIQSNYFITSLQNHNNNLHSRIEFIEHNKYDEYRDLEASLEHSLKMKGIVNR